MQTTKEIVRNLKYGELEDIVEVSLKVTGAKNLEELNELINSRFNNPLMAIPLGDWCKDNDKSRPKVFDRLTALGYLGTANKITVKYIKDIHDPQDMEKVSFNNLVLFNTNLINGIYTVMIRPNAKAYEDLVDMVDDIEHTYLGSKHLTKRQLKTANKDVANLVDFS